MNPYKIMETIGTVCGVLGAFLVALYFRDVGYMLFTASSVFMLFSAIGQKQRNFIALQGAFLSANLIGLFY